MSLKAEKETRRFTGCHPDAEKGDRELETRQRALSCQDSPDLAPPGKLSPAARARVFKKETNPAPPPSLRTPGKGYRPLGGCPSRPSEGSRKQSRVPLSLSLLASCLSTLVLQPTD